MVRSTMQNNPDNYLAPAANIIANALYANSPYPKSYDTYEEALAAAQATPLDHPKDTVGVVKDQFGKFYVCVGRYSPPPPPLTFMERVKRAWRNFVDDIKHYHCNRMCEDCKDEYREDY